MNEQKELAGCEHTIDQGWDLFIEAGASLRDIRDKKLYKAEYKSFEDYVQGRWGMGRQHAYRLIKAAACFGVLATESQVVEDMEMLPANESQIRPLLTLGKEQWIQAWKDVLQKSEGKHVTAATVNAVVKKMSPIGDTAKPAKTTPKIGSDWEAKIRSIVADSLKEADSIKREDLVMALRKIELLMKGGIEVKE